MALRQELEPAPGQARHVAHSSSGRLHRQARARLQRLVDRDTGLRALGRGHDGELDIARGIADDEDPGHARFAEMVGLDRSLPRELAAETARQVALLRLPAREEDAVTRKRVALGE